MRRKRPGAPHGIAAHFGVESHASKTYHLKNNRAGHSARGGEGRVLCRELPAGQGGFRAFCFLLLSLGFGREESCRKVKLRTEALIRGDRACVATAARSSARVKLIAQCAARRSSRRRQPNAQNGGHDDRLILKRIAFCAPSSRAPRPSLSSFSQLASLSFC